MASFKKKISINIVANWSGLVVQTLAGLFLIPYILYHLGSTAYGVWALLAGMLAYFQMLHQAFGLAINRFAAFYHEDVSRVNQYLAASFCSMLVLNIAILLLGVLASLVVNRMFDIPEELRFQAQVTCFLVAVNLSLVALRSVLLGLLRGYQMYVATNVLIIIDIIARLTFVFFFLGRYPTLIVLQACYCATAVLSLLLAFGAVFLQIPGFRLFIKPTGGTLKEIWLYMRHSLVRSGSEIIMYSTLLLLVGWLGTFHDVTIYSLAAKIPQLIFSGLASAQAVFLPAFSSLYSQNGEAGVIRIITKATRFNAMLTFMIIGFTFAYAEPILRLWLRDGYEPEMVLPARLLLLSVVPRGVFELWVPGLVAIGVFRGLSIAAVMTCAGVLLATPPLVSVYGAYLAPAIALLIGLTIRSGLWLPIYGAAKTGLELPVYLRLSLLRPVLALVVFSQVLACFFHFVPVSTDTLALLMHATMSAMFIGLASVLAVLPNHVSRCARAVLGARNAVL